MQRYSRDAWDNEGRNVSGFVPERYSWDVERRTNFRSGRSTPFLGAGAETGDFEPKTGHLQGLSEAAKSRIGVIVELSVGKNVTLGSGTPGTRGTTTDEITTILSISRRASCCFQNDFAQGKLRHGPHIECWSACDGLTRVDTRRLAESSSDVPAVLAAKPYGRDVANRADRRWKCACLVSVACGTLAGRCGERACAVSYSCSRAR